MKTDARQSEIEATVHAITGELMALAKRAKVHFVLLVDDTENGNCHETTNMKAERFDEFIGEYAERITTRESYHARKEPS